MEEIPNLASRVPEDTSDPDALLDVFIEWSMDRGLELYPAQEEAALEIFSASHVVLNTPTGSGKSLVALAMHFFSFATGRRSYYTSPIKALVSEKFFDLCRHFGAENVGMLTGDASINKGAPIICCTAEILAATALSEGAAANIHHAILDEFHYYGDRDRGMAWQLPLLLMPDTTFLLMSATLGSTKDIARRLEKRTGRPVAVVKTTDRPVPLEFTYSTSPLLDTIQDLAKRGLAPLYVVNFTQRECAELAQSLTSTNFCTKEEKKAIAAAMKGARFDTPYGKTVRKYLLHGVAVHHAGLLPKYRLLVESLGQQGLLKVICGTDTLGVGINLPIRTVVFTKLCKFDGQKVRLLSVRDFKQIAGRAGRKGFDDNGLVVCQAPPHIIENLRLAAKAGAKKKFTRKKPPERGYVHYDEGTFQRLISDDSETLTSRFTVTHAMLLNLLQRGEGAGCGYRALIDLIDLSHHGSGKKSRLRRKARMLFQSLREAEILEVVERTDGKRGGRVRVSEALQHDFSIHHSLSLFLVHAVADLDPQATDVHLTVVSLVEAILENPGVVLRQQKEKVRSAAYFEMKMEGVEYEERQEKLEKITWPMPEGEAIQAAYEAFRETHPWLGGAEVAPKSVGRDMYEQYASFNDYVGQFNLERSEGVLLRYLSQTYKALKQNVPDQVKTEALHDVIAYLREVLARADSSLVRAWETMQDGVDEGTENDGPPPLLDLDSKAFRARIRAELRAVVSAMSRGEYEDVVRLVRHPQEEPWSPETIKQALEPYFEEYNRIVFDHRARASDLTQMKREGRGSWAVTQVLCDPERDNTWYLSGRVELTGEETGDAEERLFRLDSISG
jgi:superfamily II RNA helicase